MKQFKIESFYEITKPLIKILNPQIFSIVQNYIIKTPADIFTDVCFFVPMNVFRKAKHKILRKKILSSIFEKIVSLFLKENLWKINARIHCTLNNNENYVTFIVFFFFNLLTLLCKVYFFYDPLCAILDISGIFYPILTL